MRRVVLLPEAEAELLQAAAFYGKQQRRLGRRFLAAVQEAFARLQINPFLYPILKADVRRCLTRTFPFGVVFRVMDGTITIVAIMHLRRDPEHWKQRR